MERKEKILKIAGVLLIAVVLIFSATAVTANTLKTKKITKTAPTCLTECSQTVLKKEANAPAVTLQNGGRALLWDNGLPDGRNGVSCVYYPSYPLDREVIDNFEVTGEGWKVCDGHFRIVTYGGAGPDIIDAVRVFFYGSTGPCEPDTELYAEREATFNAYLTGDEYFGRPEIAVDCEFDCVELTPGEWWVCFQPEMEDNSFWLTTGGDDCSIFVSYPDMGHQKWTKGYPNVFDEEYDVSFQLTGEEITPAEPDICCEGALAWEDVPPGGTVTGRFQVCNCGDNGSFLNWQYQSGPTWGTWEIEPDSGTDLAAGDCVTIDVTVVAPDDPNTEFTGVIKMINTDDSSDYCEIPVILVTPANLNKMNMNSPVMQFLMQILQEMQL